MRGDRLDGMMILTLTVEMPAAAEEEVYKMEFRLRDAFLRALLIHANTGGSTGITRLSRGCADCAKP